MKIRIAIIAACVGTLALAQAELAQANYGVASESKPVRVTDSGPEPVIVLAGETVVVTGSRIPQQGLYSTLPVTAVGQQETKGGKGKGEEKGISDHVEVLTGGATKK